MKIMSRDFTTREKIMLLVLTLLRKPIEKAGGFL